MRYYLVFLILILLSVSAQATEVVNYSGSVNVDGEPFDGTGFFKMAIVNDSGATIWSNDGTSVNGSQPTADVETEVTDGSFFLFLGSESLMSELSTSIFNTSDELYLKIWFDDGSNGFSELSPDIRITSAIYALQSQTLQGYEPDDFLRVSDTGTVSTASTSFFSDSGKTLSVGNASDGTVKIEADIGDAANPAIRYNVSTDEWELSNDGSTFTSISTGSSLGATDLGDITSVLAGSGLSGGGLSGAVTLTLNQAFTPTWTGAHAYTFSATENIAITSDLAGSVNVISNIMTPSATAGTTRGLFLQQADSANGNGLDTGILIDNADANLALSTGLQITGSSTGTITTAIDLSDAEIDTALALGLNDTTVGGVTLSATEVSYLDGVTSNIQAQMDALVVGAGGLTDVVGGAGLTESELAGVSTVDVGSGSGISVAADTVALGALTGDWNQTGAFDITLNNAASELKILESVGDTFYGIFDVPNLAADVTYTFPGSTGTLALTTSNVATATALAGDPADCAANNFANAIGANGDLTCGAITLTTDTAGNYVQSVANGSGITGGAAGSEGATLTLGLGALTADWNQTGAFDIALNNAASELKILESAGDTFYGIFEVPNLAADVTYTFPSTTGTLALTTGNVATATALAANPAACGAGNFVTDTDADGTLTCGAATVGADSLDFDDFVDAMTLDANLSINQGAFTWIQDFTDADTAALELNADSISTTHYAFELSATGLTTVGAMSVTGPAASGTTGELLRLDSYLGNNGEMIYSDADANGGNVINIASRTTNQYAGGGANVTGVSSVVTDSQAQSNTNTAFSGTVTNTGTTPDYAYGANLGVSVSGITGGSVEIYGIYIDPDAASAGGAPNIKNYGIYINDGSSDTAGAGDSIKHGIYVEALTGADYNYPIMAVSPSTETVAAAATITANACGTVKRIQSTGDVTSNTTDTFTSPSFVIAHTNAGCCMDVVNVDAADSITLDNNANFKTAAGADVVLGPLDTVRVCQTGSYWVQMTAVVDIQ